MRITQQARAIAIMAAVLIASNLVFFVINYQRNEPTYYLIATLFAFGIHVAMIVMAYNIQEATWNLAQRVERIEKRVGIASMDYITPRDQDAVAREENGIEGD